MIFSTILIIVISLSLSWGQPQQNVPTMKLLFSMDDAPASNNGVLIKQSMGSLPAYYQNTVKICVNGMWAFYTQPNFGVGQVDSTYVVPVSGRHELDCTDSDVSIEWLMTQTRSMRQLGVDATGDLDLQKVESYPYKYFLCDSPSQITTTMPGSSVKNPQSIGSFVITGKFGEWLVCNGTDVTSKRDCVCCDVAKMGMFMVYDLNDFPKERPLGKIQHFQECVMTGQTCSDFYRPLGLPR